MYDMLMHNKSIYLKVSISFCLFGRNYRSSVHQVLLTVELLEWDEVRGPEHSNLWLLVEWVIQDQGDVHLLTYFAREENLRATVDSHGVRVEPKVLILVEVKEADECLVLIQFKDVLLWVFEVLLIHNCDFMDSQVVSYNWE